MSSHSFEKYSPTLKLSRVKYISPRKCWRIYHNWALHLLRSRMAFITNCLLYGRKETESLIILVNFFSFMAPVTALNIPSAFLMQFETTLNLEVLESSSQLWPQKEKPVESEVLRTILWNCVAKASQSDCMLYKIKGQLLWSNLAEMIFERACFRHADKQTRVLKGDAVDFDPVHTHWALAHIDCISWINIWWLAGDLVQLWSP